MRSIGRSPMQAAAPFGLALLLCGALLISPPTYSGDQATQAITSIKSLQAAGKIPAETALRLRIKQGNMASFLGVDNALQREWETQSGVLLDVVAMPQQDSLEFIKKSPNVDLTIARNHELPDLFERGLVEDLAPLYVRFGFPRPDAPGSDYLAPRHQTRYGEHVVAIPADGDIALLFLRKDLLESPENKEKYQARFGRALQPPETWEEYQNQLMFFHDPKAGFFAALEPREKQTGWFYWLPRFAAYSAGNGALFDAQMRPRINSPAGIAATENYVATVRLSPPDILGEGKDYSYTVPFFLRGNGYATVMTPAGAKVANRPNSAIRDKFIAVGMPGHRVDKTVYRRTLFIYGNNLVIPKASANKELAFLFTQWFTDPDVSMKSISVASGFQDPYRLSHLKEPAIEALYTPSVLNLIKSQVSSLTRSGTGLPGDAEYLAALNEQLWLAAAGTITPKEAMQRTARQWEKITAQLGRYRQIQALRQLPPDAPPPASPRKQGVR